MEFHIQYSIGQICQVLVNLVQTYTTYIDVDTLKMEIFTVTAFIDFSTENR